MNEESACDDGDYLSHAILEVEDAHWICFVFDHADQGSTCLSYKQLVLGACIVAWQQVVT